MGYLSTSLNHLRFPLLMFCEKWKCSPSVMSDSLWPPPPDSFAHGILQARILGWVVITFSRESSMPRDWTCVSCTAGRFFTIWATREALMSCSSQHIILSPPWWRLFLSTFLCDFKRNALLTFPFWCFIVSVKKCSQFLYVNLVYCYLAEFLPQF